MTTILQRFHRTGRIAEVRLQDDGLIFACMFPAESEAARSVSRVPDMRTLAHARVVADDKAHADCDGDQCGRRELTPVAKADSRVLHLLYPVTIDDGGRFHKVARCPKGHHVDANFAPATWLAGLSEGTLSFYCIECGVSAPPIAADRDAVLKALRNFERNSVSRSVAIQITGHKTESVYRRYAIVNEDDLRERLGKLATPSAQPKNPAAGRVRPFSRKLNRAAF
jgi:hypothetical protein